MLSNITQILNFLFQEYDKLGSDFPNFNFNVSHHGDYVVIASEPLCLVGLDVVSYTTPQNEDAIEFVKNFSSYFSSLEWKNIMNASPSSCLLAEFYRFDTIHTLLLFLALKLMHLDLVFYFIFLIGLLLGEIIRVLRPCIFDRQYFGE